MDDIHKKLKRIRELRCECVDEVVLSPEKRTQRILDIVSKSGITLDNWELICFSALYLASQLAIVPELKQEVESLAMKVIKSHYFSGGDFGLYDENAIQAATKAKLELEIHNESKIKETTGS